MRKRYFPVKLRTVYPVLLVPLLCIILVVTLVLTHLLPFAFSHAAPTTGRVTLPTGMGTYISKSAVVSQASADAPITLAVGLKLRNEADFAAYLQQVVTPGSPLYHHYMSQATFTAFYAPLPSSEATV